jgi:hypothetical protein
MVLRMALGFIMRRGRMSCSAAAGAVASQAIHRGQLTRFLIRSRWQQVDFNHPLRKDLLGLETQAGRKTQNTYSTGNRQRRPRQGRRYNQKKVVRKQVHSFTFGLLLTPSGSRVPFQISHDTREYCQAHGLTHLTTAEAAAKLIRELPVPEGTEVFVLGDTAYDAQVVREACADRNYHWMFPANPERVFAGPAGQRPRLRSRLQDWRSWPLQTISQRAGVGKYALQSRTSRYRVGPKQKPRVYYAFQGRREVRSVGCVSLVFSTRNPHLTTATPDDGKILMSDARLSSAELIELYALRWQIELFFKELKSTPLKSTTGFAQYRFENFSAVEGGGETALATVHFLEHLRASRLADCRQTAEALEWWSRQRL